MIPSLLPSTARLMTQSPKGRCHRFQRWGLSLSPVFRTQNLVVSHSMHPAATNLLRHIVIHYTLRSARPHQVPLNLFNSRYHITFPFRKTDRHPALFPLILNVLLKISPTRGGRSRTWRSQVSHPSRARILETICKTFRMLRSLSIRPCTRMGPYSPQSASKTRTQRLAGDCKTAIRTHPRDLHGHNFLTTTTAPNHSLFPIRIPYPFLPTQDE